MCGIAGIITNVPSRTGERLMTMLRAMTHRGPDGAGVLIGNSLFRADTLDSIDLTGHEGRMAMGHVRLAITGEATALQPFRSASGAITLLHNGEIYNHLELRRSLLGELELQTRSDSEVIVHLVEKHYEGDLEKCLEKVLPLLDGVYCLAVTDGKSTIIARDRIGVRQIYYNVSEGCCAFASEKKPLLALNDAAEPVIERLLPGHLAKLELGQVRQKCFWSPESLRKMEYISDPVRAIRAYGKAISRAVQKRVAGRDRVGIIFSGGIDSFLIAYLVQRLGIPFTCYTAGRGRDAEDLLWAIQLAEQFGFPLRYRILTKQDIGDLIPEIIRDIEDHSLNQVEVAVPVYASVRMAQESGERVILSGQGADELFGGYSWYPAVVDREGYDAFERLSFEDAFLLYKECLEREDKIAMAHSIELRVPYLDPEVMEVAFRISPRLKVQRAADPLGKRVHRDYCKWIGIPENVAYRRKEAAQHGANVHTAFQELADDAGCTASLLAQTEYNPDKSVTEKLGSSSRYGFKYGEAHLWKPLPSVQYYLDSEAARLGLLPSLAQRQWQEVSKQLPLRIR